MAKHVNPKRRRGRKSRKRFSNYIPGHIGSAFLGDLNTVLGRLPESFKKQYQLSCMYSKYVGEDTLPAEDRYAAALAKWQAAEDTNGHTNQRLLLEEADFGYATSAEILAKASEYIAAILGPLNRERVLKNSNMTNGASTRVKRSEIASFVKYTGKAHVSSSALKHWLLYAGNTALSDLELELQESSVLFTVPKTSDIDRVACKEPEINMLLQRSVGNYIRKRLLRAGCNLNDQTINKGLAKTALAQGLGTLDLSSASDRISTQLVFCLLPLDWFWLLDDLRVKTTLVDGGIQELRMFSSMGNGFTFELESLLFLALVRAICFFSQVRGTISVYGDDIIAPSRVCARIARTFSFFGFKTNESKSFWRGPFRESCGGHYHEGKDVTPFYVRGPVRSYTDLIRVLNQLAKWDCIVYYDFAQPPFRGTDLHFVHSELSAFHQKWAKLVPSAVHGGQDVTSVTSLVTGDLPRKRFVSIGEPIPYPNLGGLRWWLQEKERIPHFVGLCCDPKREAYLILEDAIRFGSESPWNLYDSLV